MDNNLIERYIASMHATIDDKRGMIEWAGNVPGIDETTQWVNDGEARLNRLEGDLRTAVANNCTDEAGNITTDILEFAKEMNITESSLR